MPYFSYNSKKIYYEDQGEGKTLLLLPSNTASSAVHLKDIQYFSKKYRVICPDYLGYGKSEGLEEMSTDFWWINAEMATMLLRHIGESQYYVIGTSGGAIIALNVAILEPNKVLGVVADSFVGEYLNLEEAHRIVASMQEKTKEQRSFWRCAHGENWEKVVDKDFKMLIAAAKLQQSLNKERLNEIKCPVLFTASMGDELIPSIDEKITNTTTAISNWRIVFYPKCKHPFMWSKPDDFRQEVEEFIEELDNTTEKQRNISCLVP